MPLTLISGYVYKNFIFERAKFNSRNQRNDCNFAFGALSEELTRDRIVISITDKALSRRLQLDPELTLEKVTKKVRKTEAVQQQDTTT